MSLSNKSALYKIFFIVLLFAFNLQQQVLKAQPIDIKKQEELNRNLNGTKILPPKIKPLKIEPKKNKKKHTVQQNSQTKKISDKSKGITYVNIENSDIWYYDKDVNEDAQILVGNVRFEHDSVYLFCDSAYFYEQNNSFDAYGQVLIQQGDTLFIYSDILHYDGNSKLARLRGNVLMDNLTATLKTDSLNYDRANNVGYYFDYGIIQDSLNTLISETGHYYPDSKMAVFRKDVVLTNPKFTINSDTLKYNTDNKVASILGPTNIIYEKETKIYSEYGWYNTQNEQSKLLLNSYIEHQGSKKLIADTIFYDKINGKGEGFSHVTLLDTVKKVSLNGEYGYYIEKNEIGMVTDSALMIESSTSDTLYLHADTLYTYKTSDSIVIDSVMKSREYKVFMGYNNVRFYRNDLQGVCDTTYFNTKDSVLLMLNKPIVWNENKQLSGDSIKITQSEDKIDKVFINENAFIADSVENKYFDQISGSQIIGHMRNDSLKKIDVLGNAESIYFLVDDKNKSLIGMSYTISSMMNIYLGNSKTFDKIVFHPSPSSNVWPIKMVEQDKIYLKKYKWLPHIRPLSRKDIFRIVENQKTKTDETSENNNNLDNNGKKKTTRRDVKPFEDDTNKRRQQKTNSNTQNRPSGFDNPTMGSGMSGGNRSRNNSSGSRSIRSSSSSSKLKKFSN